MRSLVTSQEGIQNSPESVLRSINACLSRLEGWPVHAPPSYVAVRPHEDRTVLRHLPQMGPLLVPNPCYLHGDSLLDKQHSALMMAALGVQQCVLIGHLQIGFAPQPADLALPPGGFPLLLHIAELIICPAELITCLY